MPLPVLLAALLASCWTAIAVLATLAGIRRAREARAAAARSDLIEALLAAAPVVPLLAYPGGRIAMDARTGAWLGLDAPVTSLDALAAAGFSATTIATLRTSIDALLLSARPFALALPLPGSERRLGVTARPLALGAPGESVALLWIGDDTETQARIDRLTGECHRLTTALDGLAGVIEAAPFPIWRRDRRHRLALVNQAYARAVEARDPADAVHRALELVERDAPRPAARDGAGMRRVAAIVAGQRRILRVAEVPIGDAGGIAGFALDAQELEEARADLARFAEAQRAMLDRLSVAVARFAADRTLGFHNIPFRRLFALDAEMLDDHPAFEALLDRMREAERAPESRDFRAWRAERRAWFNSADPVEESWVLPGGIHLRVVAQPLPDGGLLLLFEDRSEHLQLASARDTLLRVRSATFDNLFEAVGVFAADGRLHLWNNRFRELWSLDEAVLLRHPHLHMLVRTIAPLLADGRQASLIRELVRGATVDRQHRSGRAVLRDGRHLAFAAVPLPDGNALFTLLDVTASQGIEEALRARNETLEETSRRRGDFVARMSYELRVPLTSVAGFAEMLAAGYAGELAPAARDYVDAILRAVDRLQMLIGDALDLSQGELGSPALAVEPLDVAELVRETARIAADAAKAAGIGLELEVGPESGIISGDRRRLRRCLDHLLRNALAYTPPGGRVVLGCRALGDRAEIVVSDDGVGIPAAECARLLDDGAASALPGADAGEDTGEDIGEDGRRLGRGVGLPLARQIATAHGGSLRVDSEPGRGTDVILHLPLIAADA